MKNQVGQGMTEYILIIALIAVFVIGAVKMFGGSLTSGFKSAAGTVTDANATGVAGALSGGH